MQLEQCILVARALVRQGGDLNSLRGDLLGHTGKARQIGFGDWQSQIPDPSDFCKASLFEKRNNVAEMSVVPVPDCNRVERLQIGHQAVEQELTNAPSNPLRIDY